MLIAVQAPEGMSSFSHQGYPIDIDGDGIAHIEERHRADFLAHGFSEVPRNPPAVRLGAAPAAVERVLEDGLGPRDPRRAVAIARLDRLSTEMLETLADMADGMLSTAGSTVVQTPTGVSTAGASNDQAGASPLLDRIAALIEAAPDRADRAIARELGCSPSTVSKVRRQLGLARGEAPVSA